MARSAIASVFVLALAIGGLMLATAGHAVTFSLNSESNWQTAIDAGQLVPMIGWDTGLEAHYPGMAGQLRVPNLLAVRDLDPSRKGNQSGMCTSWGTDIDAGQEIVAGWEYDLGGPSRFENSFIMFNVYPPCGSSNSVSVNITDAEGRVMSYSWAVSGVCDAVSTISANPYFGEVGADPVATTYYVDEGFDLTQVTTIRFVQNGTWNPNGTPDPGGYDQYAWNYFRQTSVAETVATREETWGAIKSLYSR